MPRVTELNNKKPLVRQVGAVMVRIESKGISIKGYRRRKWRLIPWENLAGVALHLHPARRGYTEAEWNKALVTLTSGK